MEVDVANNIKYVNQPEEILTELNHSKVCGNVIGIIAISLGPIMMMTGIVDILELKNDYLIILKATDLLGFKIPEEKIFLSEIVRVHSFRTQFDDPFHIQLREIKGWEPTA